MAQPKVYDLVGVGFGPANVALAAALLERQDPALANVLFIERHASFSWHPGMLLPNVRMQISFLKDLATLRSPASPVTFLAYLHHHDRLAAFINRGSNFPTRKEYADYLSWAAQYVQNNGIAVNYGQSVVSLNKGPDDTIQVHSTSASDKQQHVYYARNLVISPGGTARIPPALSIVFDHPTVMHSSSYALSIEKALEIAAEAKRPINCAVIGSGQSAAEVSLDLKERLSRIPHGTHQVDILIRRGSFKPSDDSPFSNEIFDPASTDSFFFAPSRPARNAILREYKSTNYGVVNPRTLDALYEVIYDQRLDADIRTRQQASSSQVHHDRQALINIIPHTTPLSADFTSLPPHANTDITLTLQNVLTSAVSEKRYDIVICATGYERSHWSSFLRFSDLAKYFFQGVPAPGVTLAPQTRDGFPEEGISQSMFRGALVESAASTTSNSSQSPSTGPGTPLTSVDHMHDNDSTLSSKVYLTRRYRLVPIHRGEDKLVPRIYVQGIEEATHGLSDTLLSVVGIRAGELVDDLCVADDHTV